jgi:hypothetical protein
MESLFKTDYPICNLSNIDMGRIEIESVKKFIENFLVRSGYGVGNSEIASMLRELADKWDD